MQFHLNGFRPGDPSRAPEAVGQREADRVDVLIVGCGPTGLTLAASLAGFPEINTRIIEQKSGPLEVGQADGIAVRSMEMFNAFGFAEEILREAYWVNETVFWKPDPERPERIVRANRIEDTEDGLSEFPHVILNQARVHDHYLDVMAKAPTRLTPDYDRRVVDLSVTPGSDHPVTVTLEHAAPGEDTRTETVQARYVVGCDGARSAVRRCIGQALVGDSANQAWGVMDILAVTDFPDIRMKALVQSTNEGNLLVIPREGGYMVRLYIELDKLAEDERIAQKNLGVEDLIAAANRILHPYSIDVKDVAWWSVYEIGQRLARRFDDSDGTAPPHVFIAGDACHTHSPKAGQGMNVSMRDAFNLGWKLASVLTGRAVPEVLHTYSEERRGVAQTLIDFDRAFAAMFSAPPKTRDTDEGVDPAVLQSYFIQHGRFTAGTAIQYAPSILTGAPMHQDLASGFEIGKRFHSAPVIRLADARPMQLGHVVNADGRWRLFAFAGAGHPADPDASIRTLCTWLSGPGSPITLYTPDGADIDDAIDLRVVFRQDHRALALETMPELLLPFKGRLGLRDYEKMFCPDPKAGDIFTLRGLAETGCMVLVRPDQHVAHVLALDAHQALSEFFSRFMIPQR